MIKNNFGVLYGIALKIIVKLAQYPIYKPNKILITDLEKAEYSNDFFKSISTINDDKSKLSAFEMKCQNKLLNVVFSSEELHSLVEMLNQNKAIGPDGISNKMLKPVAKEVSVPLSILFNRSFREGKFAEIWIQSNVIPLPIFFSCLGWMFFTRLKRS